MKRDLNIVIFAISTCMIMTIFFWMKGTRSYVNFGIQESMGYVTICTESGRKLTSLDSLVSGSVICDIAE